MRNWAAATTDYFTTKNGGGEGSVAALNRARDASVAATKQFTAAATQFVSSGLNPEIPNAMGDVNDRLTGDYARKLVHQSSQAVSPP